MVKNRIDVMVDLETLGVDINSMIIQVAAMVFDISGKENTYDGYKFNQTVKLSEYDTVKINPDTLTWWLGENPELLKKIITQDGKTLEKVLVNFEMWIRSFSISVGIENVYLWGYGSVFDNAMLKAQMERYPIFYRNDRDLRTLLETASLKTGMEEKEIRDSIDFDGEKHNAMDDCKYQCKLAQKCFKLIFE